MNKTVSVDELISKKAKYAIDDVIEVFEIFNWKKVPVRVLQTEQEKFLKGI